MASDVYAECYDCQASLSARDAIEAEVPVDLDEGGYEFVPVPICPRCHLKRHGHPCDHCGEMHRTLEAAADCCVGATKAPDCLKCGRRMSIGARGFSQHQGHTITFAECDCCPIVWGRFTGWDRTDGDCKHVEDGGVAGD